MDLFNSDGEEASLEDVVEWLYLNIPEDAPEPLLTVRNASESFIHIMAESQDIENAEE